MSKSVFVECDGIVARVSTPCADDALLFKILFDGEQISLPVTGFALEMGGNYQFLHTVSEFVYFYAFGDRISELTVTGMAFIQQACNTGYGKDTQIGSYFDPRKYNVNPFSPDFANDPRWVQTETSRWRVNKEKNSICDLYDFYSRNRIAAKAQAIQLTFGKCKAFYAFLTGMRVEIARPDIPVAQWVLRLHLMPNE